MTETNVVSPRQTEAIDDRLTDILRAGAKRLIARAVEAEFEVFLAAHADKVLPDGARRGDHRDPKKLALLLGLPVASSDPWRA